jgi:hypothetical protein
MVCDEQLHAGEHELNNVADFALQSRRVQPAPSHSTQDHGQ